MVLLSVLSMFGMITNEMPHVMSALVPVEEMDYEDFCWCVENGIDPFKSLEQRESEASERLAEANQRIFREMALVNR